MIDKLSGLNLREKGAYLEAPALEFLAVQGLTDFHYNYLCRSLEIDLIPHVGE